MTANKDLEFRCENPDCFPNDGNNMYYFSNDSKFHKTADF